MLQKSWSQT
jgi:hypothetical protein